MVTVKDQVNALRYANKIVITFDGRRYEVDPRDRFISDIFGDFEVDYISGYRTEEEEMVEYEIALVMRPSKVGEA